MYISKRFIVYNKTTMNNNNKEKEGLSSQTGRKVGRAHPFLGRSHRSSRQLAVNKSVVRLVSDADDDAAK